jgi:hypothetical protein
MKGMEAGSSISHPLLTHIHLHAPRSTTVGRNSSVGAKGPVILPVGKTIERRGEMADSQDWTVEVLANGEVVGLMETRITKCGVDVCAPMVRYGGRVGHRVSAHNTRITRVPLLTEQGTIMRPGTGDVRPIVQN